MSITWDDFDMTIQLTPPEIAKEVRRITKMPSVCSLHDFFAIYEREAALDGPEWRKRLAKYCLKIWQMAACDQTIYPEAHAELCQQVRESWDLFRDAINELPSE